MARFDDHPPPGDWSFESYDDISRHQHLLEELQTQSDALTEEQIRAGQVLGGVIKFPAADGYAYYRVSKIKPLTLQHIPAGDAWAIHPATIRGMRLCDVQEELLAEIRWRKVWEDKK